MIISRLKILVTYSSHSRWCGQLSSIKKVKFFEEKKYAIKVISLFLFQKIIFLFVFGIAMYETAAQADIVSQADILSLLNSELTSKQLGRRININNNQDSDDSG